MSFVYFQILAFLDNSDVVMSADAFIVVNDRSESRIANTKSTKISEVLVDIQTIIGIGVESYGIVSLAR